MYCAAPRAIRKSYINESSAKLGCMGTFSMLTRIGRRLVLRGMAALPRRLRSFAPRRPGRRHATSDEPHRLARAPVGHGRRPQGRAQILPADAAAGRPGGRAHLRRRADARDRPRGCSMPSACQGVQGDLLRHRPQRGGQRGAAPQDQGGGPHRRLPHLVASLDPARACSDAAARRDIDAGFDAIAQVLGEPSAPFFRFPGFADTACPARLARIARYRRVRLRSLGVRLVADEPRARSSS